MSFTAEFKQFNQTYPLQTATIMGNDFSYRYHNNGPVTLVLLTGGIGKSDLFYRHFIAFAKNYSVLTFDFAPCFETNAKLADAIALLLDQLHISSAYLIGQSYGGLLAQVITKRHPEKVQGLILSNTGSLSKDMKEDGRENMLSMMTGLKKTIKLLKFLPIGLIKPMMRKKVMKKLIGYNDSDRVFMTEMMNYMLSSLTSAHESHMCSLMVDLVNEWDMNEENFTCLHGKVMLLLSKDDNTFNDSVKNSLITMMPNPIVRTDISGGHLALFLHIDTYVDTVEQFIEKSMIEK